MIRRGLLAAGLGLAGIGAALAQGVGGQPNLSTQPNLPGLTQQARPPAALQIPGSAAQGRSDAAYAAYQAGRYVEAFSIATRRIEVNPNDATAMTLLGELISQGLGVRQDDRKAAEWYALAARRGDVHARFALGMMHLAGRGVERDEARAETLLREAAAARHGPACLNLALAKLAAGSEPQLAEAVPLLRCAAEQEIGDAQHALAVLMLEGRGLPKDEEAGADMMARAAANGSLAGEVEFAILQFAGRGIGRDERAAARGFARAAARGNAIAQNRLARILIQGRWLPRDLAAGFGWHLAARAQGLGDEALDAELARLPEAEREAAQAFAQDIVTADALTRPVAQAQSMPPELRR